jgi:hypothetical protein
VSFYRLIKADWGKPNLANGEPNPKFVEEIKGPDTYEGFNYESSFLDEKNKEGYNIYFFPNHPSKDVYSEGVKNLSGRHIEIFNYVFVDMDLKDGVYSSKEDFLLKLSEFPLKPTMVVNSGNGIHAYWSIKDLTRDAYVITQLALIKYFKTDESVYTVLQLMRFPGYMNTKKFKDYSLAEILVEYSSNVQYEISQFGPYIGLLDEKSIVRGQNHINKLDGKLKINIPELANMDEIPDSFIEFVLDPNNSMAYNLFYSPKQTYGDRSGADMKLANILYKSNFNRKEALAVIANTEKALGKGHHRYQYAEMTVDKVYMDKLVTKFKTVGQTIRTGAVERNLGDPIQGPYYMDAGVLGNPWRKKELLGLIAGPGVGKTSMTLEIIKECIEHNKDNDDIFIFFSLEMTEASIIDRWIKLVGKESLLADRLYVIGNEDPNTGEPRNIGLQEIQEFSAEIKKLTGKNIGILAIDHIGLVSKHIDVRKKYTFGIQSELDSGWGEIKTLSVGSIATQMKTLCKMLNTFIIILTQTTKDKGQGDLPIDKDGAYGISQYENIMDRIITVWQPLMRIQSSTPLRFLAFQYVKIREKHVNDRIQCYEPKLMTYELQTGDLRQTTPVEYEEFQRLLPMAIQAREDIVKKKGTLGYSIHINPEVINRAKVALGLVKN